MKNFFLVKFILVIFLFSCNSNSNNSGLKDKEKVTESTELTSWDELDDMSSAELFLNSFIEARKKTIAENNEETNINISGKIVFYTDNIKIIQIDEAVGTNEHVYSIALGVSNPLTYQIGDKHDDIVDLLNLKNIKYSLFRGAFEKTLDFNGDGIPELLLKTIDGYRTSISGTQTIWFINNKTELKQSNIIANTEAEVGICDGPIGFVENMVFDENKKQVRIERIEGKTNGEAEDCSNYSKETSTKTYVWDDKTKKFIEDDEAFD